MPLRQTLSGVPITLNLANRDYYGFRDDALDLIPILTSNWTDLHTTDPGIVTIELFCGVGDVQSYYIERCANENFLFTCQELESGLKFAEFAQYTPRQNVSAVASITVTVSGAGTVTSGFAIGTQPELGQEQIRFELAQNIVATGAGDYTADFYEGETYTDILGSSDGAADQYFYLPRGPVAYNPNGTSSLIIDVNEGAWASWIEVDNFNNSSSTDTHFIVRYDSDGIGRVRFGDGVNGKIPNSGTDNIRWTARIGGGIIGNQVGQNTITEILESNPGIVTGVTNADSPQGGEDPETLMELKTNIPTHIRTNDRAVTIEDYAFEAEQVSGVVSAKAARGTCAYGMFVYARAAGENPIPSGTWNERTETGTGLLGQIGSHVNSKRAGPIRLCVLGPSLVRIFLEATIYILDTYFNYEMTEIINKAVSACLNGYELQSNGQPYGIESDIPNCAPLPDGFPRNMGDDLKKSYLNHMLESIQGVDYVDITRLQRDPYARKLYDFNADSTFSSIYVNSITQRNTWTIEFYTDTEFTVSDLYTGIQTATGSLGVLYTSDASEMSFTLTAGSIPNFAGNRYEIVTGPHLDNIEIGEYELLTNYAPIGTVHSGDITLTVEGGILR